MYPIGYKHLGRMAGGLDSIGGIEGRILERHAEEIALDRLAKSLEPTLHTRRGGRPTIRNHFAGIHLFSPTQKDEGGGGVGRGKAWKQYLKLCM